MDNEISTQPHGMEDVEIQEWLESLDSVLESSGPEVAAEILERLRAHATVNGIDLPFSANTPYANTIPVRLQPLFPGDQELERRIKSLIRWNAVAMALSPLMAIYQARFNRYLEDRGMKPATDAKVWAFLGDGETDEPESLGAITLASREKLDNLIFVINCNLQRLDGPVRGNGQIIQELESAFRGARWNVI